MKQIPMTWLFVAVAALCMSSAYGCDDAGDVCGGNTCTACGYGSDITGSCPCARFKGQVNNKGCNSGDCASCNLYGCDCTVCEPGCTNSCPNGGRRLFETDAHEAKPSRALLAKAMGCADHDSFMADNITAMIKRTDGMWCEYPDTESIGYLFFGYLFSLMDSNHDGVVSCTEYVSFGFSDVKKILCPPVCACPPPKPLCQLRAKVLADANIAKGLCGIKSG